MINVMVTFDLAAAEQQLSPTTFEFLKAICKKDGQVLKAGPKKDRMHGRAFYIWRMLVFQVSSEPQHQCLPVMADCYLRTDDDQRIAYHDRREECKKYDKVVDEIMEGVPKHEWHGIIRWGRALGQF